MFGLLIRGFLLATDPFSAGSFACLETGHCPTAVVLSEAQAALQAVEEAEEAEEVRHLEVRHLEVPEQEVAFALVQREEHLVDQVAQDVAFGFVARAVRNLR